MTLYVSTPRYLNIRYKRIYSNKVLIYCRVYHTGECGLHHNKQECNNKLIVQTIKQRFKIYEKYLFPKQMVLYKRVHKSFSMPKPNGGWGDPRDHQLCLNQTLDKISL